MKTTEIIKEYPIITNSSEFGRSFRISSSFCSDYMTELLSTLREYINGFAWSSDEMSGIDLNIACHGLHLDSKMRAIKQKMKPVVVTLAEPIREEINKLLEAGFIREVQYLEWLANVVMVPKAIGKWRMCVDFTNLNNICPKDSYPFPRIDVLVDSAVGYLVMSFLDVFSGYHQIMMHPADEEKTDFITAEGVFCYTVIPFGLKNTGATYQRMMDVIFANQKGKNLEVYVDDLLIKSTNPEQHIKDLKKHLKHSNISI